MARPESERQQIVTAIEGAKQSLYNQLDQIAGAHDIASDEFLPLVENALGEQPDYADWIDDTWDPTEPEAD
jgi:hypothetical protein